MLVRVKMIEALGILRSILEARRVPGLGRDG
jgi:hypothetical protein